MGLEAECTVRVGRKSSLGKAKLEADALQFRGGGNFALDFPFDRIRGASVDGDALVVRTDEQEARFELGAHVAERWLKQIKEPKGLLEKLEIGPDSRIAVVGVNDAPFLSAVRELVASMVDGRVPAGAQTVFFGAETKDALEKVPLLRARMAENGSLWIIRPKGSKAISEADVLATIRAAGLVDTKVVAFSRTHTAHKSMIPLELRGKTIPRPPIVSIPPPPPADLGAHGESEPRRGGTSSGKLKAAAETADSKKKT